MTALDLGGAAVVLRAVPWTDPVAVRFRAEQHAEIAAVYGGHGDPVQQLPAEEMLATVVADVDGVPAGCVALRTADDQGPGTGEVKRLYVSPEHRGRGLSRILLAEVHRLGVEHGLRRLVLMTADRLTAAIALYSAMSWDRIPSYAPYVGDPALLCFEYVLPTPA